MSQPRLLLVGESPPPRAAPDFRPFDCASGTRLANAIGLRTRGALLEHVARDNLFPTPTGPRGCPSWDDGDARKAALRLFQTSAAETIVALGQKVARAFDGPRDEPFGQQPPTGSSWAFGRRRLLYLPHPSGSSPALQDPAQVRDVRRALLPELVGLVPTLRVCHFTVAPSGMNYRQDVHEDLAVALAPTCPGLAFEIIREIGDRFYTAVGTPTAPRSDVVDLSLADLRDALTRAASTEDLVARIRVKPHEFRAAAKRSGALFTPADGAYRRHAHERRLAHGREDRSHGP